MPVSKTTELAQQTLQTIGSYVKNNLAERVLFELKTCKTIIAKYS